jgi:hypothetical protein
MSLYATSTVALTIYNEACLRARRGEPPANPKAMVAKHLPGFDEYQLQPALNGLTQKRLIEVDSAQVRVLDQRARPVFRRAGGDGWSGWAVRNADGSVEIIGEVELDMETLDEIEALFGEPS